MLTDREKELADEIWRAEITRAQVEAEIVAWLRSRRWAAYSNAANAIERGEHRADPTAPARPAPAGEPTARQSGAAPAGPER